MVGERGLESAKKTVSGRCKGMSEGSEVCLGEKKKARGKAVWGWGREETAEIGDVEWG